MSIKVCACKGIRKCLLCENGNRANDLSSCYEAKVLRYCVDCQKAFPFDTSNHPHTAADGNVEEGLNFPGIHVVTDFVSEAEELELCNAIDRVPWVDSQSGRRKQDFGPKVNFKKKKVNIASFSGFPRFSQAVVEKFSTVDSLHGFLPVELCDLEYTPERGSAIDPHIDDVWLWGERLVTLNLLSSVVLTMSKAGTEVHVDMPRRSLVVVMGPSRFVWQHCVKREHVTSRRLAMTFRELSNEFLAEGEQEDLGRSLLDIAQNYR